VHTRGGLREQLSVETNGLVDENRRPNGPNRLSGTIKVMGHERQWTGTSIGAVVVADGRRRRQTALVDPNVRGDHVQESGNVLVRSSGHGGVVERLVVAIVFDILRVRSLESSSLRKVKRWQTLATKKHQSCKGECGENGIAIMSQKKKV
jgi:hypothetical protein